MIKVYLEQAIKAIETEKEKQVSVIRERIMRERIAPLNAEIDTAKAKALSAIDNELNAKIVELKQLYETKKQELIRLGEEKKKANMDSVLTAELATITFDYDNAIVNLQKQIDEIKE